MSLDTTQRAELVQYIRSQVARTESRLRGYTIDRDGTPYPRRSLYSTLQQYLSSFYKQDDEPRWIVVPGLRGVGKTTLLAQLYLTSLPRDQVDAFYLSIDEVVRRFNATLWDVMEAYEELLGQPLERLNRKVFFFLDEVHYDPQWDVALKTFYDRSKNIFILCTGSSATLLRKQLSADSARRSFFVELFPLQFAEYITIHRGIEEANTVAEPLRQALFASPNADKVVQQLKELTPRIRRIWLGFDEHDIQRFLRFGTLPFALTISDEAVITNQIEQMVQKIIYTDIAQLNRFDHDTLNKVYSLTFLLAQTDKASLTTLSRTLEVAKATVVSMLRALEDAGLIQRIPPHGSPHAQTRKPAKYLFTSPALRYWLLRSQDSISPFTVFKGKLLEDSAGLSLRHALSTFADTSLTYDATQKGADFIARLGQRRIPIEIGYGSKDAAQVQATLKRTRGAWGLVIDERDKVYQSQNIIFVPLSYWLLM